jgi:predicted permease
MDSLRLDLRYAARALWQRPGFTAIAVVTLALGIGVNTVAFSAVDALLLRPFRIADADRIGWVMVPGPGNAYGYASSAEHALLERSTPSLDGIAAEARVPVSLRTAGGAEQAWSLLVSTNYLPALGVVPTRGRVFTDADVRGAEVPAVVSHRFWTDQLGANESLGDLRIVVNGRNFPVIGVLPDDFQGPGGLFAPDMWLPLARMDVLNLPADRAGEPWLMLFARLKDGASKAQAEAELAAVARELSTSGDAGHSRTATFHPMADGHPDLRGISTIAWIAFAVVGVVLVIACVNVTALLMARATERQKEIGIRCAVGASRGRILRQLATEGLLLALLGGIAAILVAAWSERLLSTFSLPSPIPQRLHLGLDAPLVGFTAVLVLLAGVLPALLPALQATRGNLVRSMRMESVIGGRPSRTRHVFVVAQIAGSTVFIVAALLFVQSFTKSAAVDPGFDTARTATLQLSPASYGYDDERSRILFDSLRQKLTALPGVRGAALADRVPFYVGTPTIVEYAADAADCAASDCREAKVYAVGAGHFGALGIPIEAGRDFSAEDVTRGATVVISHHLAAQLWPGSAAIGRSLRLGDAGETVEVVGVAADIKHRNMMEAPDAYIYRPLRPGQYAVGLTVIVRTHEDPRGMLSAIREQVRALDPDLPTSALATMTERMRMPLWPARTAAGFLAICAAIAVLLGSIGLFGVMHFSVAQRTREFGIRTALGATPGRVMRGVLSEGLRLTVPGVILGGIGGYAAGRLLARGLFGISPADPLTFAATAAIEIAVTLAACALPAFRATHADPVEALRG